MEGANRSVIEQLSEIAKAGDKQIKIDVSEEKFIANDLLVIQSTNFTYTTTETFKVITKSDDQTLTLDKLVQHPHVWEDTAFDLSPAVGRLNRSIKI